MTQRTTPAIPSLRGNPSPSELERWGNAVRLALEHAQSTNTITEAITRVISSDTTGLLKWEGDWTPLKTYRIASVVKSGNTTWLATKVSQNLVPAMGSDYWWPLSDSLVPAVWSGGQIDEVIFWDKFTGSGAATVGPDVSGGLNNAANGYNTSYAFNADGRQSAVNTFDSRSGGALVTADGSTYRGPTIQFAQVRFRAVLTLRATTDFRFFWRQGASSLNYARLMVHITGGILYVKQNTLALTGASWSTLGYLDIGEILDGDQLIVEDSGHSVKVIYRNLEIGEFTGATGYELRTYPTTDTRLGVYSAASGAYLEELKIENFPPRGVSGIVLFHDKFGGGVDTEFRFRTPDTVGNAASPSILTFEHYHNAATPYSMSISGEVDGTNPAIVNRIDGLGFVKTKNASAWGPVVILSRQTTKTNYSLKRATTATIAFGHRISANSLSALFVIQVINGETIKCYQNIAARTNGITPVLHELSSHDISIADGDQIVVEDRGVSIRVLHAGSVTTELGVFLGVDGSKFVDNLDKDIGFCGEIASGTDVAFLDELVIETLTP